jgi:hypothetical protein
MVWDETGKCQTFSVGNISGAVGEGGIDIRLNGQYYKAIVMAGDQYYFAYLLEVLEIMYGDRATQIAVLDG